MEISKTEFRKQACLSLGEALFLERRKRRLNLYQLSKKSSVAMVDIDNIETGKCADIGKIARLLYFYQKKLQITLTD